MASFWHINNLFLNILNPFPSQEERKDFYKMLDPPCHSSISSPQSLLLEEEGREKKVREERCWIEGKKKGEGSLME